jgi:hypothetical protein
MPRSYRQLELDERRTIFRLLDTKVPVAGGGAPLRPPPAPPPPAALEGRYRRSSTIDSSRRVAAPMDRSTS